MANMKLFLKGMLIGIGKIIPGVSGSMIAISLGLYEKLINSLSNLFKDFKNNALFLLKIGSGILIAIILVSKVIVFALNTYYLSTILLFIGLIIGGVPSIISIAKKEINLKNIIILVIPFIIFLIIDIITNSINLDVKLTLFNAFWLGLIEAISMIIPGVSGTAIMIMLGVYEEVLLMFSNLSYIYNFIFFIMGVTIGILSLCKFIGFVLDKYNVSCYYAIMGFVTSSIIIMLKQVLNIEVESTQIIIGIFLFIIGVFVSHKMK